MRKTKIFKTLGFGFLSFMWLSTSVNAATITVHYNNTDAPRITTYNDIRSSMSRYNVVGYNNGGIANVESQLKNSVAFVAHHHGAPGRQFLNTTTSGISGTYSSSNWKSINAMTPDLGKPLYIAIYYGCETGQTSNTYGNIVATTTTKFAKSAVAWTISTYVSDVNTWNKYFFEKAKNNSTASAALTYADTKLAADTGAYNASGMKSKRVTSGSFSWSFREWALKSKSINDTIVQKDLGNAVIKSYDNSTINVKKIDEKITSANKTFNYYADDNNNEYIYDGNTMVGYINNNNDPLANKNQSYSTMSNTNILSKKSTAEDYLNDILERSNNNLSNYELIESSYSDATDEFIYLYGKRINGYLVNDSIIISINSKNELVSYIAPQQGLYDRYTDLRIDKNDVNEYIAESMKDIEIPYAIDREFINLKDGNLVLQIGIKLIHTDGSLSTTTLYYNI